MTSAVTQATYGASEEVLVSMVLERERLPEEFRQFELLREGVLDNAELAEQGFPGNTAESFTSMGRITGYMREFAVARSTFESWEGADLMAATVVHLFQDEEAVSRWMADIFVRQFEENVGKPAGSGQELVTVERVKVDRLQDKAVGIRAVQESPEGLVSSTVIDFRVGRLLGVAFVVSLGDVERGELAEGLAVELERQMVRVVLGAA